MFVTLLYSVTCKCAGNDQHKRYILCIRVCPDVKLNYHTMVPDRPCIGRAAYSTFVSSNLHSRVCQMRLIILYAMKVSFMNWNGHLSLVTRIMATSLSPSPHRAFAMSCPVTNTRICWCSRHFKLRRRKLQVKFSTWFSNTTCSDQRSSTQSLAI